MGQDSNFQYAIKGENLDDVKREINFAFTLLADVLDGMSGFRGEPQIHANMSLNGNRLTSVAEPMADDDAEIRGRSLRRPGANEAFDAGGLNINNVGRAIEGHQAVPLSQVQEEASRQGLTQLATVAPPNIATVSAVGTDTLAARGQHTHGLDAATFTITGTGFTVNPTGTASYVKVGSLVLLRIPSLTGTSNATVFTLTGLPALITPAAVTYHAVRAVDNAVDAFRLLRLNISTTIDLFTTSAGGAWTAAGTKTLEACVVTYLV